MVRSLPGNLGTDHWRYRSRRYRSRRSSFGCSSNCRVADLAQNHWHLGPLQYAVAQEHAYWTLQTHTSA
jgi:hypothetical protein